MLSIAPAQLLASLRDLQITHVIYLPDAVLGLWDEALAEAEGIRLVRICREGEAWPLALGLRLGGARPLVVMQSTGLFESGDSLRNILFDLSEPLYALIGYRSYLSEGSTDTARRFTEPVLAAWGLEQVLVATNDDLPRLVDHYRQCQAAGKPGVALIAEGRM